MDNDGVGDDGGGDDGYNDDGDNDDDENVDDYDGDDNEYEDETASWCKLDSLKSRNGKLAASAMQRPRWQKRPQIRIPVVQLQASALHCHVSGTLVPDAA